MIVMRSEDTRLMNLAPYENGVTVNLGNLDRPALDWSDEAIPVDTLHNLSTRLYDFLPGIRSLKPIDSVLYTCQKLNIGQGRYFYWKELQDDFFTFYSGKFTQCLYAAEWIMNNILVRYGFSDSRLPIPGIRGVGLPPLNHPGSQATTLSFSFEGEAFSLSEAGPLSPTPPYVVE
jgi:hypothetical protein